MCTLSMFLVWMWLLSVITLTLWECGSDDTWHCECVTVMTLTLTVWQWWHRQCESMAVMTLDTVRVWQWWHRQCESMAVMTLDTVSVRQWWHWHCECMAVMTQTVWECGSDDIHWGCGSDDTDSVRVWQWWQTLWGCGSDDTDSVRVWQWWHLTLWVCGSQIVITNKLTHSVLQAGCPSCRPTNSDKALKGRLI